MTPPPLFILILEDEGAHVEAIHRAFQSADLPVEIRTASCLREYRDLVADQAPDLAIMDLNLPDGRAVDVLTSPSENGPCPVILMTSYGNEEVAVEAIKAGALDYVVKSPQTFARMPHIAQRVLREWNLLQKNRQAEKALYENEARSRLLVEHMDAGIVMHAPDTSIQFANPKACRILGLSEDEMFGRQAPDPTWCFIREDGSRLPIEDYPVVRTLSTLEPFSDLIVGVNRPGTHDQAWVLASGYPVFDENREIEQIVITFVDITERKRAEEFLREESTYRRILFEQSPDGILIIDPETAKFLEFNTAAHRQLGYSREEFAQLRIFDLEVQETAEETKGRITDVLRNGRADFETRQRTRQGEIRNIHVTAQILDIQGHPVYHCIWRDITERKRIEEVRGFLARTSSGAVEGLFFEELARYLAQNLAMDFVCIDRLDADGLSARTVAVWCDGHFEDNVTYALKDTPCADVVGKTVCCFPASVCQFFPRDQVLQDLRAESYVGVTLWNHSGQPIGLIAVIGRHPLTNRHLAEEVLKLVAVRAAGEMERLEAEEALRLTRFSIDHALDAIFWMTPDARIADANEAACLSLGYTREELLRLTVQDIDRLYDAEKWPQHFAELRRRGSLKFESEHRARDGRLIPVEIVANYVQFGSEEINCAFVRDLTERKRTEAETSQTMARRQREAEVVAAVASSVNLAEGALKELAIELTEAVSGAIGVARVGVWLFEENETRLVCLDNYEAACGTHSFGTVLLEHEFRNEFAALISEKYVDAHDALTDPRTAGYVEGYLKPNRIVSMLDAIIRCGGQTLGTICLEHVDKPHHWENDEISFACQIADQVALAISNREHKRAEKVLQESEARYRTFIDETTEGIYRLDLDDPMPLHLGAEEQVDYLYAHAFVAECNLAFVKMHGFSSPADLMGTRLVELHGGPDHPQNRNGIRKFVESNYRLEGEETEETGTDGLVRYFSNNSIGIMENGFLVHAWGSQENITARKQAEEALKASENYLGSIFRSAPVGIGVVVNRILTQVNQCFCRITGYAREEALGKSSRILYLNDEDFEFVGREKYNQIREHGTGTVETRWRRKDGATIDVLLSSTPIAPENLSLGVTFSALDITERKRAEEEKGRLESQLQQAQKMESVGRLAGGVAHDFNNMLSVILGHAEMAQEQVDPVQPLYADLQEIRKAAERSANLTRQLLAFARKQTVAPRELDLNETVEGMLKMLQRLIGENIALAWQPMAGLWTVKIDPSQIDQLLANLCVNSRDAIAGIGQITIGTENVTLDSEYSAEHTESLPGQYVRLTVRDSGCGMDKETLAQVFEPFFTTKELGRGTGLGLSTVYGIIKQNNGFINVYSEPGHGTLFSIYLPRYLGKIEQAPQESSTNQTNKGCETVLLVEDEQPILELTTTVLKRMGYTVLATSEPAEAIRLAEQYNGRIDLLMTDVVMPEMNGRDLAERLLALYPGLKRLFMSGYTADVIAHHGVLDEGVNFIQKPFTRNDLGAKLRQVLGDR